MEPRSSSTLRHVPGAVVGGALWALCFRSEPGVVLPWFALLPLFLWIADPAVRGRGLLLLGWLHGAVSWLLSVYWIAPTLTTYGELPVVVGAALLLLLALYLGLYHGVFALAAGWLRAGFDPRRGELRFAFLVAPALWVLLEGVRTVMFSGFPWNLAAYALVEVPGALDAAALVGSRGLSWWLVAVNGALAVGVLRRRWLPVAIAASGTVVLLAAGWLYRPENQPRDGGDLEVRIVQPDVAIFEQRDEPAQSYRRVLELARTACDRPGALVVLPESATWPYAWQYHETLRRDLQELAASSGCALLLNTAYWTDDDTVYNSVALVTSRGVTERYDKNHLVPYGEYVPLRDLLPFVGTLARNAGDFSASDRPTLLDWQGSELGVSICFEIIFPEEVAMRVGRGASVLVTVTNDAWYGRTSAPWQHLRSARFRAAENRRPLVRSALTGISAFVDPRGGIADSLGIGESGILSARVRPVDAPTPWSRWPFAVPVLAATIVAVAIGSRFVRQRHGAGAPSVSRGSDSDPPGGQS